MIARESLRVLVVDGNHPEVLRLHDLFARVAGYELAMSWAPDYAAGLTAILSGGLDVAIVAGDLEGKAGAELVREARACGAAIPLILLEASEPSMAADEAARAGADDAVSMEALTPGLVEHSIRHALERRTMLLRVRELEQRLNAFGRQVGTVAHDFTNVITAIVCEAELMKRAMPRDDPRQSGAHEIIGSSIRAAALARQLLVAGKQPAYQPQELDLNAVVSGVKRMLRPLVGTRVHLETSLHDDMLPVAGELSQLEQVVVNLVVNARDAAPEGGRVSIATRLAELTECEAASLGIPGGDYVVLSVEDNGAGMTDDVRARLFEPFFTTKAADEGTGLGLTSALDIVTRCGGVIAVDSVPGMGSRFDVYLPRAGYAGVRTGA